MNRPHITITPIGQHIAATQSNLTAIVFFACVLALAALTTHALIDWNHTQEVASRV